MTGFLLGNYLLIVTTGALVDSSGAILSYIMCRAMNRNFLSVILGGFGGPSVSTQEIEGEQIAIDVDEVPAALEDADSSIFVPGYGMAIAQAQQSISELTRRLRAKGKTVCLPAPLSTKHLCPSFVTEGPMPVSVQHAIRHFQIPSVQQSSFGVSFNFSSPALVVSLFGAKNGCKPSKQITCFGSLRYQLGRFDGLPDTEIQIVGIQ